VLISFVPPCMELELLLPTPAGAMPGALPIL
jgi:hypothetical protein